MITATRLGPHDGERPLISIIVPTIKGREQWLQRCLDSYRRTSPSSSEVIVVHDRPTCGIAWNDGIYLASGKYIHFSADDLEAHEGWWREGVLAADNGLLAAPRILNPDGTLQSCGVIDRECPQGIAVGFTRIPFLSEEQAEKITPIIETHYSTDVWVSEIGRLHGYQTVMARGYLFTHHFAQEGRVDERLEADNAEATKQWNAYRKERDLPLPVELWGECE